MDLAEQVLQRPRLVLDHRRGRAEHAAEHLERVAQALGGDAQVVQLRMLRRVAHRLVEREQVGDPLRARCGAPRRPAWCRVAAP